MLVISDTNILSSLAAGDALSFLFDLFPQSTIAIPPAVHAELQAGIRYGQTHLQTIVSALSEGKIEIVTLHSTENKIAKNLPAKLNSGECEAIALAQNRSGLLLTNDKRAVRYCLSKQIPVFDLTAILRLFWTQNILSQKQVRKILQQMKKIENLQLSSQALETLFHPK